jgi:D-lactate dehydrogenase
MMKSWEIIMKISFYDTKPYDKLFFEEKAALHGLEIEYFEEKLNANTAVFAKGSDAVVAFVNDNIDKKCIEALCANEVGLIALRCAGFNNVDLSAACGKIKVVRVPAYSPYAVAEYTMGLLLTVNRKLHKAYNRTREYNFSLNGLTGFDLHGKTVGVIGTGKIGRVFIDICRGFGMNILAYDMYPVNDAPYEYVSFDYLCENSDIISLHCPLTKQTRHMINEESIKKMKNGVVLLNTSRGALIDSEALLEYLKEGKIAGAGLDVYEEETDFFYEDHSDQVIKDDILARLVNLPNVLVSSHQAFLTREALENIAETTISNIKEFEEGRPLTNEVSMR